MSKKPQKFKITFSKVSPKAITKNPLLSKMSRNNLMLTKKKSLKYLPLKTGYVDKIFSFNRPLYSFPRRELGSSTYIDPSLKLSEVEKHFNFNLFPNESLQYKMDYLMTPYNHAKMHKKYIDFSKHHYDINGADNEYDCHFFDLFCG